MSWDVQAKGPLPATPQPQQNSGTSVVGAGTAPQQAQINSGLNQIGRQQDYTVANAGLQQGYLQGEAGFQQAGLNLQGQDLQTQIGALQRQFGLLPQYNTLQQQLFGLQSGSLDEQQRKAQIAEQEQKKGLMGGAAASGSLVSDGTRQGLGDIEQQLNFALQDIDRSRQQLDVSKQQYNLGYNEKTANLQDQQKFLDTQSKRLGISQEELVFRLNQSIKQLGLSTQVTYQDLVQAGDDLRNGIYNPLSQYATAAMGQVGVNPIGG